MLKKKLVRCGIIGVAALLILVPLLASCAGPAAEEATPTAPATEEPAAEEPAAEEPAAEEPAASGPPAIPHSLEGRDDCLMCHGAEAIKPYPADHAGRTSDTCQACHQPAG